MPWLQIQKQTVSRRGYELTTKQTDRQIKIHIESEIKRKTKTERILQREREKIEEEECSVRLDKNPDRSTALIGVPPNSVTQINVRESDSLSS